MEGEHCFKLRYEIEHNKTNENILIKKNIVLLTYDSRLLSAARASSGDPIVTNAKPLFLILLYIES